MKNIKSLVDLFFTFFKIGAITFGGGIAMLPILERELSEKRGWTNNDELLDYYAIGQSTPGIIAVNVATFVGNKRAGAVGGIVATAGIVCPSILIITFIATCISNFSEIIWVQKALRGINIAVAALLTNAVIKFAKKTLKGIVALIIFLIAFFAIFLFNIGSVYVILFGALSGIIISYIGAKNAKHNK